MMHPGWKVFMQGWGCGMFIVATMAWLARGDILGASVCGTIFILTFVCGGLNADRLKRVAT
jgi:hypothetical protein